MDTLETLTQLALPLVEQPLPIAWLMVLWALLGGATVGSFLNVVIARVPEGQSVVHPRSRCPRCSAQIAWYDNVPVLSWIVLRARCRSCQAPISARYPLIEALVALLAVGLVARHGFSPTFLELFAFSCVLVVVAFIDLDTWHIPLVLPALLLVMGLAVGGVGEALSAPWAIPAWLREAALAEHSALLERGLGAAAGFLVLGLVNIVATYVLRVRGTLPPGDFAMGWGDPILVGGMGAVLGWRALPWLIFLGSLQGAVVGIVLLKLGRMPAEAEVERTAVRAAADEAAGPVHDDAGADDAWVPPPTALPWGPFLALAGLEVAFFGDRLASLLPSFAGLF
jgi:leader peptidase (prepilin peptidase) / N-methyltransferase